VIDRFRPNGRQNLRAVGPQNPEACSLENDPYINAGVAKDFQAHLKHVSLRLLPAGHWLQLDEPGLVAKEMLS
jgi:hypothetical protein